MRHERIDVKKIDSVVAGRDVQALLAVRVDLVEMKKHIESQLADDTAAMRDERADMLEKGMHPREADMRASATGDQDWRARAGGLNRIIDTQLSRIRVRLSQLTPAVTSYSAVSIVGAGRSGDVAAKALNELVARARSADTPPSATTWS